MEVLSIENWRLNYVSIDASSFSRIPVQETSRVLDLSFSFSKGFSLFSSKQFSKTILFFNENLEPSIQDCSTFFRSCFESPFLKCISSSTDSLEKVISIHDVNKLRNTTYYLSIRSIAVRNISQDFMRKRINDFESLSTDGAHPFS